MSDSIRRLLEQQERLNRATDPHREWRRHLDPLGDANERLAIASEAMRAFQAAENRRKLLTGMAGGYPQAVLDRGSFGLATEEAERLNRLMEGPIADARRLGLLGLASELHRSMAAGAGALRDFEHLFRRPGIDEIGRLAEQALSASALAASAFGRGLNSMTLEATMGAMSNSWLNVEHAERSARAFAEIQAMGRHLNERPPFDAAFTSSLRPNLGDWRDPMALAPETLADPILQRGLYIERGFNPALTDFTVPAFVETIEAAGLLDPWGELPELPDDNADADADSFARSCDAYRQLLRFEIEVRRFIANEMRAAYGETWMERQLPPGMMDKWRGKRDSDVKVGLTECPLIEYADLGDYIQIIERRDNWKTVFQRVFDRQEDARESFQRLYPIRNPTMHARLVVTLEGMFTLRHETMRVLRAIRKAGG